MRALRVSRTVSLYSGANVAQRVDAARRPDHDPDPHECELPAAPGEARVVELVREVGRVEVAVDERQDHEAEERDHEQQAGQVVERHADAGAEDVEGPDADDQADCDQVLEPDVHGAGREVPGVDVRTAERVRPVRLVREPRRLGDVAAEDAEKRQHDRPADPVAERGNRPDEGRVLAPALVRVEREAAGLVREHRGKLRVEHHDGHHDRRRDSPEQRRSPAAEVEHRPAERAEEEPGIRERDHEPVVPAERLQELSFFDLRDRHARPPSSLCLPART